MEWEPFNVKAIKGKYLYKFLSEKHIMDFLKSGNIWFARSDMFGDKMECVTIEDLKVVRPDFSKIESRKRKHLISCFHEAHNETLAFWDTYSETKEKRRVYALRINREEFIKLIADKTPSVKFPISTSKLIHGKVKYKNLISTKKEKLDSKKVKYPAFRKEYAFAYEREYRFVIRLNKEDKSLGWNLNLGNAEQIPFAILVNPLLENSEYINCLNKIDRSKFKHRFELSNLTKWLKPELW